MQFGDRGLNEIMNNPTLGDARVSDARDRIAPLIAALVERAKHQGAVRPDLDQSDVIFLQVALSAIMDSSRAVAPDLHRRYLAIFLDGIHTDRGAFTPLAVAPLTAEQTHQAMTRRRRGRAGRPEGPAAEAPSSPTASTGALVGSPLTPGGRSTSRATRRSRSCG